MTKGPKNGLSYRDAGVDVDAGNALVDSIKPLAGRTDRPGVMSSLGGFGALFDLKKAGYTDPILVSGTDGVGTKLKIAIDSGIHHLLGIDLVAMCVNDLVVQGAEPLFFLDYFATGRLDPTIAARVVEGIAEGCVQAGCALIGGETAEMPGVYGDGDYDLAGFAVGAVERDRVLTGDTVTAGDVLLGLGSSGLHSNGFSLVRKVVETQGLDYAGTAPFDSGQTLAEALLTPTRIYVKSCLAALAAHDGMHALCHITGGGFVENLPRVLPDGLAVDIDVARWPLPPVFSWLAEAGGIAPLEMARVFNCGIGMVVFAAADEAEAIAATLAETGETVHVMGQVAPQEGDRRVRLVNMDRAW